MEGVTASGATATAKETFGKTINVVVEIFVPVAAAVGGFFMPAVLGGGSSVANAAMKAGSGASGATTARIGWAIQALVNAAVGGAFWTLRGHGNIIAKAIGGAVGGFFLGGAVGCLPGLFAGSSPPSGLIDKLATSIQSVATES